MPECSAGWDIVAEKYAVPTFLTSLACFYKDGERTEFILNPVMIQVSAEGLCVASNMIMKFTEK
jgi:hypothetical protein